MYVFYQIVPHNNDLEKFKKQLTHVLWSDAPKINLLEMDEKTVPDFKAKHKK